MVEKLWRYVKPFSYNTSVSRTDRQTDGQTDRITISISRVSSSMLTRDKNRSNVVTTWRWSEYMTGTKCWVDTPTAAQCLLGSWGTTGITTPLGSPRQHLHVVVLNWAGRLSLVWASVMVLPLLSWSYHWRTSSLSLPLSQLVDELYVQLCLYCGS